MVSLFVCVTDNIQTSDAIKHSDKQEFQSFHLCTVTNTTWRTWKVQIY